MTPYRDLDRAQPVPLTRVTCELHATEVSRRIENFDLQWPSPLTGSVMDAGLAFLDFARAAKKNDTNYKVAVSHAFVGRDSDGNTRTVSFARLEGLEVLSKKGDQVQVRLRLFPTTDIEAVARNNISYTALRKDVAEVVLDVQTRNDRGEELALVDVGGKIDYVDCSKQSPNPVVQVMQSVAVQQADEPSGPELVEIARFADLRPGHYAIKYAHTGEIWWAVPSVTADPTFPLRRRTKR